MSTTLNNVDANGFMVGDRVYTTRVRDWSEMHPALRATLFPANGGWRMGTIVDREGNTYRVDFGGLVGTIEMDATEIARYR
jgi:hypothetical protein